MPDRQTGELTAQEARACVLRAQGKSKAQSVREAFPRQPKDNQAACEKASRLFAKPQVQARVRELLAASTGADIISIAESIAEMETWKRMAVKDRNHNALTSYKRMEWQRLGLLKDTVAMTIEGRADDLVLLEKLAKDDPVKLAALRQVLGAKDTFDA